MNFALLLLGLVLLLVGGAALVSGASRLATRLGVSPLVVGLTVVAFGTSAPELVVNILGAIRNETDLAFGNVAGSNLANLGLVLGTAAMLRPVTIGGQIVRRELPLLMLGTSILAVMTMDTVLEGADPRLSRSDGVILLLLFSIFVYITVSDFLSSREDALLEDILDLEEQLPERLLNRVNREWAAIIAGIVGLGVGGHLTIVHGSALADAMGVSPAVVGLVIVAVGTSLPELVTSVIAAIRKEADLCVGNVVGSNIFNCLVVLPISAIVRPLPIPDRGLLDITMALLAAAVIVPIFLFGKARMGRAMGAMFVAVYLAYMTFRVMG